MILVWRGENLPREEEPGADHGARATLSPLTVDRDDVFSALLHPGLDDGAELEHGEEARGLVVLEWEAGDTVGEPVDAVLVLDTQVEDLPQDQLEGTVT